jgi:hypothetical protein
MTYECYDSGLNNENKLFADWMLGNGIIHLSIMYIKVREARKGKEWTIHSNWQYLIDKKQDKDKQNKKQNKQNTNPEN